MDTLTTQTTPAPAGQTGYETTNYAYDGKGQAASTDDRPPRHSGRAPDQMTTTPITLPGSSPRRPPGTAASAASTIFLLLRPAGRQDLGGCTSDGNTSGTAPCSAFRAVDGYSVPPQANYQTTYGYYLAGDLVPTITPATTAAPNGATTTSTYDSADNTLTSTDPNGVTTTWSYTPLNQVATVSYSGSSAHAVTYTYDASGNKTGDDRRHRLLWS